MIDKEWVFIDKDINMAQAEAYSELFEIPLMIAKVLINRGYTNAADAKKFLEKDSTCFYSPSMMQDMDKAAGRLKEAIENREKVTVYGDYDVDGITATALLISFLRSVGVDASAYIPDRLDEGYGINKEAVAKISGAGASLLISVDTGITAFEEVEFAKSLGMDVIITDHHECNEQLPGAVAVVNPKRVDCEYPFKDLAGVGVAFKLVCAVSGKTESEILDQYADIIALGTIADVVPLCDENRVIASRGIEKLKNNPNVGLAAIISSIGMTKKWNNSAVVSYSIAPRLNAAGRMSNAMTGVNLLLTNDESEAYELALRLDEENKNRQNEEKTIFNEAVELLGSQNIADKKILVLAKKGWHHGIIGVVASRICEKYNKTCILISIDDGWCKCSGRSIEGINLYDALSNCSDILEKFGGHAYAAGFLIKEEYIDELDRRLNEFISKHDNSSRKPQLLIDSEISVFDINSTSVRKTELLAPYGAGNKVPIFALMEVRILDIKTLSDGKHCRILAESKKRVVEAIAFGAGSLADEYNSGDIVDLAGELNINLYNGQVRLQMILCSIRFSHLKSSDVFPVREDFVDIYRYLRKKRKLNIEMTSLTKNIREKTGRRILKEKIINVLRVFRDVKILKYHLLGDIVQIDMLENEKGKKISIDQSKEYRKIKEEVKVLVERED